MPEVTYTQASLDAVLAQEQKLRYPERFGSVEALDLGYVMAVLSREYDRGTAFQIVREGDGLCLFQWFADDKAARNYRFIEAKRRAAIACGHSSLFARIDHQLNGSWERMFADGSDELAAGGAFPIYAGGTWVATVSASGLHHGQDHELITRALAHVLHVSAPAFPGTIE